MNWAETIVQALKDWDTSLIAYVPDISIHQVTSFINADPYFHLVSATREEEAIGIAVGAYATGCNSAVFMQSSGFGNTINAIASLCVPARVPIPMFINLRGGPGEFNIAQVPMGRATRPILDQLGLVHFTLEDGYKIDRVVDGALKLCHANRQPVAICLTQLLQEASLLWFEATQLILRHIGNRPVVSNLGPTTDEL
jgi:sulfopyruvate decarboxylase subunit alpha